MSIHRIEEEEEDKTEAEAEAEETEDEEATHDIESQHVVVQ